MNKQEIKEQLAGPIASIRTPFFKDGEIDFKGLQRIVDAALNGKSKTLLLTAGDSHYDCMSDCEIADVTIAVCKQAKGRAMVVAADRLHATARAREFADFAKKCGAEVVMTLPPTWQRSVTAEGFATHYAAVAEIMPVMIVTNIFRPLAPALGLKAIGRALELSDNIVSIKEDVCGHFAQELCLLVDGRCNIFCGGRKLYHMSMWPFGVDGYLSTFINFRPDITWDYCRAVDAGDLATMQNILRRYDNPLIECGQSFGVGLDAALHGVYELFGLCGRWRRTPYHSMTDEQMNTIREMLQTTGILK